MGNHVIITGASSGIGHATAALFRAQDCTVTNLSRTPCNVEGVANITVDLADKEALEKALEIMVAKLEAHDGKTVLVQNAAMLRNDTYSDLEYDDFLDVLKVNVLAVQMINKALLPLLKKGSSVIYIGSTLSEKAAPFSLSYTTTKHALAGLMKATAQGLAGQEIHSCLICPGFTDTEMLRTHLQGDMDFAESKSLFKRLVRPEEIGKLVMDCADSPAVNGAVIHANLGQTD